MTLRHLTLLAPALLLAPLNGAAQQGVVLRMETTVHAEGVTSVDTVELRIDGGKVAVPEAEQSTGMIFRSDQGEPRIIAIDHIAKVYMVLDAELVDHLASQMELALRMMESLPPEQREAIERAQEEAGGAAIAGIGVMDSLPLPEIRATDERDEMHGFPVRKYDVYRGERKVREVWSTEWSNIEGGDQAAAAFESMAAFFDDVMGRMPEVPGGQGAFENPWSEVNIESGFPVMNREFAEDGSIERESALIASSIAPLDPADFEPPAGYGKVDPGAGSGG